MGIEPTTLNLYSSALITGLSHLAVEMEADFAINNLSEIEADFAINNFVTGAPNVPVFHDLIWVIQVCVCVCVCVCVWVTSYTITCHLSDLRSVFMWSLYIYIYIYIYTRVAGCRPRLFYYYRYYFSLALCLIAPSAS